MEGWYLQHVLFEQTKWKMEVDQVVKSVTKYAWVIQAPLGGLGTVGHAEKIGI